MLSPQGVFHCFLIGHSLRTDWREVCSLSEGQETVSQWMRSFDDLIKPRAKSVEDYSDVLDLINLFGSHLRFGAGSKGSKSHGPPSLHEYFSISYFSIFSYSSLFIFLLLERVFALKLQLCSDGISSVSYLLVSCTVGFFSSSNLCCLRERNVQ